MTCTWWLARIKLVDLKYKRNEENKKEVTLKRSEQQNKTTISTKKENSSSSIREKSLAP
jgi:hypothetical protein